MVVECKCSVCVLYLLIRVRIIPVRALRLDSEDYGIYAGFGNGLNYITVQNVEIKNCNLAGLRERVGNDNWTVDGVTSHHNGTVDATLAEGIAMDGIDGTVRNSTVYQNGTHGISYTDGSNPLVEHNTAYDNYHSEIDIRVQDGGYTIDNPIVRYNTVYATIGGTPIGMYIANGPGGSPTNIQVYYNVVYNIYRGIGIEGTCNGIVYNNTVYNSADYDYYINNGTTALTLKNNVAKNTGGATNRNLRLVDTTNKTIDYNDWNVTSGIFAAVSTSTTYSSWAAYQAALAPIDAHSINTDPLFVSTATPDFHLQSSSLAINAGIDVGLTSDFDGNTVPAGAAPDMGAYEYGSQGMGAPENAFLLFPLFLLLPQAFSVLLNRTERNRFKTHLAHRRYKLLLFCVLCAV